MAAQPGFQSRAIFSSPLYFDRLDLYRLGHSAGQWRSGTKIKNDFRRTIRRQQIFFGFIAKHRHESLVDAEEFSFRIASAYSVSGILHQRAIQRLRMPQGLSGLFQFGAQSLFVQDPTNRHGQLSDVLSFYVIECTISD